MLGFGEEDYSTREGAGSGMSVAIHVQGQTTEDLTVRVIPVTFEQFQNRFGSIPSDISLQNFDTAEGEMHTSPQKIRGKNFLICSSRFHCI